MAGNTFFSKMNLSSLPAIKLTSFPNVMIDPSLPTDSDDYSSPLASRTIGSFVCCYCCCWLVHLKFLPIHQCSYFLLYLHLRKLPFPRFSPQSSVILTVHTLQILSRSSPRRQLSPTKTITLKGMCSNPELMPEFQTLLSN